MTIYRNPARDPDKQALDWVRLQDPGTIHAWVLGYADSKHIHALRRRYPHLPFTVLEHDGDLTIENAPENVVILQGCDESGILSSPRFADKALMFSPVLDFTPYTRTAIEYYQLVRQILRAQTAGSFLVAASRVGIRVNEDAVRKLTDVQIKNVIPHLLDANRDEVRLQFQILRELVT